MAFFGCVMDESIDWGKSDTTAKTKTICISILTIRYFSISRREG